MRLFGLKGRHAWNVVHQGGSIALVDVTFAEDDGPLVLVGTTLEELYQRAAGLNRVYCPSNGYVEPLSDTTAAARHFGVGA